jgi:hypothetical protein
MRVRTTLLALAILPAALCSVAADVPDDCTIADEGATTDGADDVLACAATAYLSCEDAQGGKYHAQITEGPIGLTFDEPTESFTAGGGCGTQDDPIGTYAVSPGNPFYDVTVEGFAMEGNLDTMIVELHDIYVGAERSTGTMNLQVRVELNSKSLFGTETLTPTNGDPVQSPTIIDVPVKMVRSSTGASESMSFSIGGLQEMFPGVAGVGTGAYQSVRVTFTVPAGAHALVWGATEVPASISFNQGLAGTVLELGTGRVIG